MIELNKIYCMDCLEGLKQMEEGSVDLIVSDPPYQLNCPSLNFLSGMSKSKTMKGFMGKEWDVLPTTDILKECLRVLKDGAFSFWLMTPRQDSQAEFIIRLREAGFNIGFTPLYFTYASGFPKALNIQKVISKRYEKGKKVSKLEMQELFKTIIHKTKSDGQGNDWTYLQEMLEDLEQGKQYEIFSYSRSKIKSLPISQRQKQSCLERWSNLQTSERKLQWYEICKMPTGIYINGKKGWLCYGTQISDVKTSWEKTYVEQALKNKKGITWLDECRIPYRNEYLKTEACPRLRNSEAEIKSVFGINKNKIVSTNYKKGKLTFKRDGSGQSYFAQYSIDKRGRFPANLLVSDDVLNDGNITKSNPDYRRFNSIDNSIFNMNYDTENQSGAGVTGSFSRYFDLDKWFIKNLPKAAQKTFPFLIVPKPSSGEKNENLDEFEEKHQTEQNKWIENDYRKGGGEKTTNPKKNSHPTIKPLKLMNYLITLGSREGDVILDPFIGSGTTAISSRILSRKFIGFEKDKEYHKIAEARIKKYMSQMKLGEF